MMIKKTCACSVLAGLVALANGDSLAAQQRKAPRPAQAASANPPAAPEVTSILEPRALAVLEAMSRRLTAARTMTFTAVATYESPSVLGPALAYSTISEVTLQRPDKLRVVTAGDGPASEFYYDGRTMTAFAPAENLVAVAEAPPTIDAALEAAHGSAAIYFPFTDVVVADPYRDLTEGLTHAFFIGQSRVVGGTTTDMVAIANDKTFAQFWVGADDKLPRRIRAIYLDDPSRLWHQVDFSDWKLDGRVAKNAFASERAAAAQRIQFARPDPPPPPPQQPPAPGGAPKKKPGRKS
jgi:hypothetical protein